jgi:Protein of unknown function (DUF3618)
MTQSIEELEREIAESRARLDATIDELQDRLSVSGIIDDLMGYMRVNRYSSLFDDALTVVRKNPVPVMLVAAGVGWLIHRMTQDVGAPNGAARRRAAPTGLPAAVAPEPLTKPGSVRVYADTPVPPSPGSLDQEPLDRGGPGGRPDLNPRAASTSSAGHPVG